MTVVVALLTLITGGALSVLGGMQDSFNESERVSRMADRAERALSRLGTLCSRAVTIDDEFAYIEPDTGVSSTGIQFRLLDSVVGEIPNYDDSLMVFLLGPSNGTEACAGVVVGRGPDRATVWSLGKGADNVLGTEDDDTRAVASGTQPAVELLIPSDFAPRTGEMLRFDREPDTDRLIRMTLRLNVRNADGDFILLDDLVLEQRVALRQ